MAGGANALGAPVGAALLGAREVATVVEAGSFCWCKMGALPAAAAGNNGCWAFDGGWARGEGTAMEFKGEGV